MTSSTSSALTNRTKEVVQARLAQSWSRTIASKFEGNKTAFAAKIGCHPDTVSNALSGKTVPELHTVLNSLCADESALDELAAEFGIMLMSRALALSPDMVTLGQMGHAMTQFIEALADGKRSHKETLELAELLRPLVPRLTQIVHEADGLKAVA